MLHAGVKKSADLPISSYEIETINQLAQALKIFYEASGSPFSDASEQEDNKETLNKGYWEKEGNNNIKYLKDEAMAK